MMGGARKNREPDPVRIGQRGLCQRFQAFQISDRTTLASESGEQPAGYQAHGLRNERTVPEDRRILRRTPLLLL